MFVVFKVDKLKKFYLCLDWPIWQTWNYGNLYFLYIMSFDLYKKWYTNLKLSVLHSSTWVILCASLKKSSERQSNRLRKIFFVSLIKQWMVFQFHQSNLRTIWWRTAWHSSIDDYTKFYLIQNLLHFYFKTSLRLFSFHLYLHYRFIGSEKYVLCHILKL